MQKLILFFITCLWIGSPLRGQVAETGTNPNHTVGTPLALYHAATVFSPHLYNGPRYHIYDSRAKDHQFFLTEEWQQGSVHYDGQLFENIQLMYDIVKGVLVVRHMERSGLVQLQSERISSFSLLKNRFIKIQEDREKGITINTGFYHILYEGKTQVLARRIKDRQEQIENNRVSVYFPEKNFFYIKKDGVYHIIRSKKAALNLFNDQKGALRRYLRENKIKYRKTRELALVQMAIQYDKLRP